MEKPQTVFPEAQFNESSFLLFLFFNITSMPVCVFEDCVEKLFGNK